MKVLLERFGLSQEAMEERMSSIPWLYHGIERGLKNARVDRVRVVVQFRSIVFS
jgi:hypothetical protein